MKSIVLTVLFVTILVLSGCIGVDGNPVEFVDAGEVYDDGFLDGCVLSVFMLTRPQDLPTYERTIEICMEVREASESLNLEKLPSETNAPAFKPTPDPVICDGNCI